MPIKPSIPSCNADILDWRHRMGWSQREAARQLGITLQSFQDIESGITRATGKPRKLERRTALACAFLECFPALALPAEEKPRPKRKAP